MQQFPVVERIINIDRMHAALRSARCIGARVPVTALPCFTAFSKLVNRVGAAPYRAERRRREIARALFQRSRGRGPEGSAAGSARESGGTFTPRVERGGGKLRCRRTGVEGDHQVKAAGAPCTVAPAGGSGCGDQITSRRWTCRRRRGKRSCRLQLAGRHQLGSKDAAGWRCRGRRCASPPQRGSVGGRGASSQPSRSARCEQAWSAPGVEGHARAASTAGRGHGSPVIAVLGGRSRPS